MSELSSPRITAQYLDSFVGRLVTMIGKVTQLRGEQATIDADGIVTVNLNRVAFKNPIRPLCKPLTFWIEDAHLVNGNGVQIIGKVNPDLSIKVLSTRDLGSNVDYALCTAVVEATHRHKEMFIAEA